MDKGLQFFTKAINNHLKYKDSDSCTCVDGLSGTCPVHNKRVQVDPDEYYEREREAKHE